MTQRIVLQQDGVAWLRENALPPDHAIVTSLPDSSELPRLGFDGWREGWGREAYILTESRVETALPESDLFVGVI